MRVVSFRGKWGNEHRKLCQKCDELKIKIDIT